MSKNVSVALFLVAAAAIGYGLSEYGVPSLVCAVVGLTVALAGLLLVRR